MASGIKIIMEFLDASGSTVRHSYNYGDDDANPTDIKAYMNYCITNSTMWKNPPASISKAYAEITSTTDFDLS